MDSKVPSIRQQLSAEAEAGEYELIFFDGFDAAILGTVEHFGNGGHEIRVCYDRQKCINILRNDGMSVEEAEEYFGFNASGAYTGPATPAFLSKPEPTDA